MPGGIPQGAKARFGGGTPGRAGIPSGPGGGNGIPCGGPPAAFSGGNGGGGKGRLPGGGRPAPPGIGGKGKFGGRLGALEFGAERRVSRLIIIDVFPKHCRGVVRGTYVHLLPVVKETLALVVAAWAFPLVELW